MKSFHMPQTQETPVSTMRYQKKELERQRGGGRKMDLLLTTHDQKKITLKTILFESFKSIKYLIFFSVCLSLSLFSW